MRDLEIAARRAKFRQIRIGNQAEVVCNLKADLSSRIELSSNVLVVLILINLVAELPAIERCSQNSRVFAYGGRDSETAAGACASHIEADRSVTAMKSYFVCVAACANTVNRKIVPIGGNMWSERDAFVRFIYGES